MRDTRRATTVPQDGAAVRSKRIAVTDVAISEPTTYRPPSPRSQATRGPGPRPNEHQPKFLPRLVREPLLSCILKAVEIAVESHARTGGVTVSLSEGNLASRNRFAVAVYPERTIELSSPPTRDQLETYVIANLDLLLRPGHALGTWFDEQRGVHTIDVVVCPFDRDVAIGLGARSRQWAIYDLAVGRDIVIRPARLHGLTSPAGVEQ